MNRPNPASPKPDAARHESRGWRDAWPTWLVVFGVFVGWFLLLKYYPAMHAGVALPLLTLLLTLHGSMSHELIHGHPATTERLNDYLGAPPLGLWFPYWLYKKTHLRHHRNDILTFPGLDPESFFYTPDEWRGMSKFAKGFAHARMTLAGRMLLGPMVVICKLLDLAVRGLRRGGKLCALWLLHFAAGVGVVWFAAAVFAVPVWHYLAAAYFAQSLILMRSFYEHRPAEDDEQRSVIMLAAWPWSFLFLNNNYHSVHHEHPQAAWHRLPKIYRDNPKYYADKNGGFVVRGYRVWFQFLFRPVASPLHPLRAR